MVNDHVGRLQGGLALAGSTSLADDVDPHDECAVCRRLAGSNAVDYWISVRVASGPPWPPSHIAFCQECIVVMRSCSSCSSGLRLLLMETTS